MNEWWNDAACSTLPTDVFYAERGQNQDVAKSVCFRCPAQTDCLRENMHELHGVWGGTTPVERVLLRTVLAGRQVSHGRRGWHLGCRCEVCVKQRKLDLHRDYERRLFKKLREVA